MKNVDEAVVQRMTWNIEDQRTDRVKEPELKQMVELRKQGLSIEDIAEELDRDSRTVQKHLIQPQKRAARKQEVTQYLFKDHLDNLRQQVRVLSCCLVNPQLYLMPEDITRKPLEVNGQDWRLDPVMWFYLCTPDLRNEKKWGPDFIELKTHMKASPFWKHHLQLLKTALVLERDYEDAAKKLAQNDKEFGVTWIAIQAKRRRLVIDRPSKILDYPEPDWERYIPCCDHELCDWLIRQLAEIVDDVDGRLTSLEEQLQQLNDDLLPGTVNRVIAKGCCSKCR